jgi:CheY-like chemotaxis protein
MAEKPVILCVDDEEPILRCLKRILEPEGFAVLTAGNGEEGLKVLNANKVDLIITDQRMPVMDGSWFLRTVKKQYPGMTSIMLSGYSDFDALVRALNEGEVFRFLTKPWDNEELIRVVKLALEGRRVLDVVSALVNEARKSLKITDNISVDVAHEPTCITMKVGEDGAVFSEDILLKFLELVFNSLGVTGQAELKTLSGYISRQKGTIVMTIDMGKGMSLRIETPSKPGKA